MSEDIVIGKPQRSLIDLVQKIASIIVFLGSLLGGGYVVLYKIDQAEADAAKKGEQLDRLAERVDVAERQLSALPTRDDMRKISTKLSDVQERLTFLCSELVRSRKGNVFVECRTGDRE